MEYIISLIWVEFEMLSMYCAYKAFLPARKNSRWALFSMLISGIFIYSIRNFKIIALQNNPYINIGTSFIICLFFAAIAFRGHWYSHLMITTFSYLLLSIIDTIMVYVTAALLAISFSELIWRKWLYVVIVTTGKCIFLFLIWGLLYYRSRREHHNLSGKRLLLITIFPLVSIVMLYTIFDSYKIQDDLSTSAVVFSAILGISNVAIIYLINSLERASRAEQVIAILNQSMALQTENIMALEKSYRAQRSATHEFKHQLQVIYDLLKNGDVLTAQDYIYQLQNSHTARIFAVNTNHPIVDAILNEKYHVAKDSDIDIHYKVNDLSALTITTDSLVVLLSNLLDNAIEACQRLPDNRMIECSLLLEDNLFLSIRNTALPVKIVNGEIKTSKLNKSEHGFGLVGVRRVLKQLDGEYAMDYSGNWFQFVAEIPIK